VPGAVPPRTSAPSWRVSSGADDAKVKVLGEYINHHVEEEEGEIFPKVRKARIDTITLGEEIAVRKAEVMEQLGVAAPMEE
jgi:hypothetical protein